MLSDLINNVSVVVVSFALAPVPTLGFLRLQREVSGQILTAKYK